MAEKTDISWTDATFSPWIGCTKVSPGCDSCYAAVSTPSRVHGIKWGAGEPRHRTSVSNWKLPKRWNKKGFAHCPFCGWRGEWPEMLGFYNPCPACRTQTQPTRRRVFCSSLADVFDNEVDPVWRADLFDLIDATPNLDWQLLTKRIGNVGKLMQQILRPFPTPLPDNVWIGSTIVNQEEAERDIPKLLAVPARVRFLSIEPMLGPVNLRHVRQSAPETDWSYMDNVLTGLRGSSNGTTAAPLIGWVIAGGESGPHARPSHPDWYRLLREQCAAAGVPFHFKQWGCWAPGSSFPDAIPSGECCDFEGTLNTDEERVWRVPKKSAGRLLDGVTHDNFPRNPRCLP